MAWAGAGALCIMQGAALKPYSLSRLSEMDKAGMTGDLSCVQISDSHIGFNEPANPDVATLTDWLII
jgi:3',5'-cyclic-AMP phosphodiesterase